MRSENKNPGRTPAAFQLLFAIVMIAGAYAFVLQDRLREFPHAFAGFGFHPEALADAPFSKQVHVIAGVFAIVLGLLQLWLPKGTTRHRAVGYTWVTIMTAMSISALFIQSRIGLLQMLAVIVLGLMARAVWLVRQRDIAGHARLMRILVLGATLGVGLFTALPGRVTWLMFFSGQG